MTFIEALKESIKESGQAEVASRIGVSQPLLSWWVNCKRLPGVEFIPAISRETKINITSIVIQITELKKGKRS